MGSSVSKYHELVEEGKIKPVEKKRSWSVIMSDELYCLLPPEVRGAFDTERAIFNDWEIFRDDPHYQKLYKASKVAKQQLREYTFKNRERCLKKLEAKEHTGENPEKKSKNQDGLNQ